MRILYGRESGCQLLGHLRCRSLARDIGETEFWGAGKGAYGCRDDYLALWTGRRWCWTAVCRVEQIQKGNGGVKDARDVDVEDLVERLDWLAPSLD